MSSNRRCAVRLADKVAFLKSRRSYPGRPAAVAALETHFAWVFLTPRRAYKLKKPLRLGAMDYRSLRARQRGCLEELRLNRRLAPKVYLSLVPLSRGRDHRLHFGERGPVEEYLVKMRRLPSAAMLDQSIRQRRVGPGELRRLVHRLAQFFECAPRRPISASRYLQRLRRVIRDDHEALRAIGAQLPAGLVQSVTVAALRLIERMRGELGARGRVVVEGHGDLRAEHVCLAGAVDIIDCLEFDPELRRLDPAQEAALLALEIERLGDAVLARAFLGAFRRARRETISDGVLQFYMGLNAMTRAKLASWHVGDPQFPNPRPWIRRARQYLLEAQRHLQAAIGCLSRDNISQRVANARAVRPAATLAVAAPWPVPAGGQWAGP